MIEALVENLLRWIEPLRGYASALQRWVESQRIPADGLSYAAGLIAVQCLVILGLLTYALILRRLRGRRLAYRTQLYTAWHYLVPAFLSDQIEAEFLLNSVRPRDYRLFAEFLRPYLADLKGSEPDRLVDVLRRIGFLDVIKQTLRHRNPWRRAYAINFLSLVGDTNALPALREALYDPSPIVVNQAAEALMRLKDVSSLQTVLSRIAEVAPDDRERIPVYLMEYGIEVLPVIQKLLRDGTVPPWLLAQLLQVLAYYRYTPAVWDMMELYLNTEDRELRIAAVKGMAATSEPVLQGFFEYKLLDKDPVIQAEAARALGEIGTASQAPALAALLRTRHFWVVKYAVASLIRLGVLSDVLIQRDYGRDPLTREAWGAIYEHATERILNQQPQATP